MNVLKTEITLRHAGVELVRVALPPGQYTIGREEGVDIYANTPLLSRKHARLTIDADHLLIEDLGSRNGTFIGDRPVTRPTRLPPDQPARLGDVQLEIRRRTPAAPAHAPSPARSQPIPPPPASPAPPASRPPQTPPRKSKRKSQRPPYGGIAVGVVALGIVAFLLRPKEERLTSAELYARAHRTSSAPNVPGPAADASPPGSVSPPQESPQAMLSRIEDLRRALLAAKVQGLKDDAIALSPSGKIAVNLSNCSISDLAVLGGYPVDELHLSGTRVTHLEPLRDLPLVTLHFNATNVTDVAPLVGIPTLTDVILGKSVKNLETLRASTSIKRISYDSTHQGALFIPSQTAAEFWKMYDQQKEVRAPAIAALHKMGVKDVTEQQLTINKAGKFEINLASQPISDLAPLAGLSIARLDIGATKVSDLAPLHGMALQALNIRACPVSDLTPLHGQPLIELIIGVKDWKKPEEGKTKISDLSALRGMPLNKISLDGAVNPDLAPLADCPSLRIAVLPQNARNVESLRKLTNLKKISWGWPGSDDKIPSSETFWKEYSAKNGAAPSVAATKPGTPAATPKKEDAPVEELTAEAKAFGDARQKRLALLAKFQFDEAHSAILDPALQTEKARNEQEVLGKKAQWLANFKSQLIEDLNKNGYATPITRKTGAPLPGAIVQANDQQVMLRSPHGPIPVPWTEVSLDSVYTMGASFILPDMPKEIAAFRKWQLGVFASFVGKKQEGLALLQEAAQLKPVYKGELPIFQNPTDPW